MCSRSPARFPRISFSLFQQTSWKNTAFILFMSRLLLDLEDLIQWFSYANSECSSVLVQDAVAFFSQSGLPKKTLSSLWQAARDSNGVVKDIAGLQNALLLVADALEHSPSVNEAQVSAEQKSNCLAGMGTFQQSLTTLLRLASKNSEIIHLFGDLSPCQSTLFASFYVARNRIALIRSQSKLVAMHVNGFTYVL